MQKSLIHLIFLFQFVGSLVNAQVVDKTRLEYEEDQLTSKQMGMSISHNHQMAAFLFENGEISIFDLNNSVTIATHTIDLSNGKEIAFTKDDKKLVVVEEARFRLIDWKSGETLLKEERATIKTMRVADISNHFAIGLENSVEIWNTESRKKERTLEIKYELATISFSSYDPHIILNAKWRILKNRFFIYNYQTGLLIKEYNNKYMASYDNTAKSMFFYQNVGMGIPVFGHRKFSSPNDSTRVLLMLDGKTEKASDVGFYLTTLRVKDKAIAAAGYRGFTVFDVKKGGRVFTTKKTKRERSSKSISVFKDYNANPHYLIGDNKVIINAYGDNINQIYSVDQNEIIGYIFTDAGGSFAVVSRDGRFDGTADASRKLYWTARNSNKKTSLESTFSRGFSPGLLISLLSGNEVIAQLDIDNSIESLPELSIVSFNSNSISDKNEIPVIETGQKKGSISVEISKNLDKVEEVKLFQNNKLIGISQKPQTQNVDFEVVLTNSFGEENFFYTLATTDQGIDSEKRKLIVKYKGITDEAPKLYLVTVGINEYRNPKYNLNYAIADANAFTEAISTGASGMFDQIEHINIRNADFTKSGIMDALSEVRDSIHEQDLLVFYYAGHGVMSAGLNSEAEFYLVPNDITQLYGKDDVLKELAVSASDLRELSKSVNAQKQVFILDACQAAAALDVIASRGVSEERAIAHLARSTGTFWITATGSEQFATEFESLGHGVFTYALLEGLSGKADGVNPDKRITVRELSAYVESRVPQLSEQYKGKPQFPSGYSFGNDFPIVVYE